MKKTKEAMNEILKEAMSKKYCGSTRFDFLDDEEIPMIREAMYAYASQQTSELKAENERLRDQNWQTEMQLVIAEEGHAALTTTISLIRPLAFADHSSVEYNMEQIRKILNKR